MPVPRSGAVRRHSGGTAYAGRNGRLRLRQCPVLSRPGNPGGLGMLHGGRNVALLRTPAFRRRFRHRFRISATGILVSSESDRRGPGQIPMVHAPRQVADAADRLAAAHLPVQKPDARLSRCGGLFSYNISSTFINEQGSTVSPEQSKGPWRGEYDFKVVRDNRWGYGLAAAAVSPYW